MNDSKKSGIRCLLIERVFRQSFKKEYEEELKRRSRPIIGEVEMDEKTDHAWEVYVKKGIMGVAKHFHGDKVAVLAFAEALTEITMEIP